MKRKTIILGLLALLCLTGTGIYAWVLYGEYRKQVEVWNEEAKTVFEEALWMEVDKRSEIPFYSAVGGGKSIKTFKSKIPDTVQVMTPKGFQKYKIDRYKYEHSLIKETIRRADLGALLEFYPLSIDTLSLNWNSLLSLKQLSMPGRIRYVYTDLDLNNDTVFSDSDKQTVSFDSLTTKYMGFRCEHELTAYVAHPSWLSCLSLGQWNALLLPWLLLLLLGMGYSRLESWTQRKLVREKTIEKEIHLADVSIDQAGVFKLPDGTIFDTFAKTLTREGMQQRLQPQSVTLLKLFLSGDNHQVTSDTICLKLWNDTGQTERLYSAIRRLRNDLKEVKSDLIISCSYGVYELKSPISSKNSDQN